jgi:hypothetical protein
MFETRNQPIRMRMFPKQNIFSGSIMIHWSRRSIHHELIHRRVDSSWVYSSQGWLFARSIHRRVDSSWVDSSRVDSLHGRFIVGLFILGLALRKVNSLHGRFIVGLFTAGLARRKVIAGSIHRGRFIAGSTHRKVNSSQGRFIVRSIHRRVDSSQS